MVEAVIMEDNQAGVAEGGVVDSVVVAAVAHLVDGQVKVPTHSLVVGQGAYVEAGLQVGRYKVRVFGKQANISRLCQVGQQGGAVIGDAAVGGWERGEVG